MADNNNEEQKYNLYTEHIVPDKGKKVKRYLKKLLFVLAAAVVFGVVAGLVMIIIYRVGGKFLPETPIQTRPPVVIGPTNPTVNNTTTPDETESETDSKEPVTLSPTEGGETTEEPTTEKPTMDSEEPTEPTEPDRFAEVYDNLKKVTEEVAKSQVSLMISTAGNDPLSGLYQTEVEYFGVIVAQDTEKYYILTSYATVNQTSEIKVTYNNNKQVIGEFVSGDAVTKLAIVAAPLVTSEKVGLAKFGDSTLIVAGDPVFASGMLYGINGAVGYGMIVKTGNVVSGTDSQFAVMNTNMAATDKDAGIICNTKGEIVGIITDSFANGYVSAYTVESIRSRIEAIINAQPITYLGIQGQSVTADLQERYGIPEGIYVSAVEVGSPAYSVGIQTGDVIVKMGNNTIKNMSKLMEVLSEHGSGESINITIKRKGRDSYKEIVFSVVLGVQ